MISEAVEMENVKQSELALYGGQKTVLDYPDDTFAWPIITEEDEEAVLAVLRTGRMSGIDVTVEFEKEFAAWNDAKYALAFSSGTAAIYTAMFACKVGIGDEIICPSITYWASAIQVFALGGTVVFADIDPETMCIDPKDLERCITPRTKAIVVVHYLGYPADMDPIMEIARKHGIKVIEDVSHAQGGLYKGRKLGTIGDVGAMSLMTGKSFPIGEGGMIVTNDREIYDRSIAFGHYERYNDSNIETEYLKEYAGLPMGGMKGRMHQLSSAMGRVQIKYFDQRSAETRKAMNYFWDLLEGVPGMRAHRVDEKTGSTMGGWYQCHGLYRAEELGGLSVSRFSQAVRAEGIRHTTPGVNQALHTHPVFQTADIYGHGKPTRIANSPEDVRKYDEQLPVSEKIGAMTYLVPLFKKYYPEVIKNHADAYKKVAANYRELLKEDGGDPEHIGVWHFAKHK